MARRTCSRRRGRAAPGAGGVADAAAAGVTGVRAEGPGPDGSAAWPAAAPALRGMFRGASSGNRGHASSRGGGVVDAAPAGVGSDGSRSWPLDPSVSLDSDMALPLAVARHGRGESAGRRAKRAYARGAPGEDRKGRGSGNTGSVRKPHEIEKLEDPPAEGRPSSPRSGALAVEARGELRHCAPAAPRGTPVPFRGGRNEGSRRASRSPTNRSGTGMRDRSATPDPECPSNVASVTDRGSGHRPVWRTEDMPFTVRTPS
jgi:hypothetical protein